MLICMLMAILQENLDKVDPKAQEVNVAQLDPKDPKDSVVNLVFQESLALRLNGESRVSKELLALLVLLVPLVQMVVQDLVEKQDKEENLVLLVYRDHVVNQEHKVQLAGQDLVGLLDPEGNVENLAYLESVEEMEDLDHLDKEENQVRQRHNT